MADSLKALMAQGLTKKQAKAVIRERKKKGKSKDSVGQIKSATAAKNAALDDILNWK